MRLWYSVVPVKPGQAQLHFRINATYEAVAVVGLGDINLWSQSGGAINQHKENIRNAASSEYRLCISRRIKDYVNILYLLKEVHRLYRPIIYYCRKLKSLTVRKVLLKVQSSVLTCIGNTKARLSEFNYHYLV